jgi:hypothetical protein
VLVKEECPPLQPKLSAELVIEASYAAGPIDKNTTTTGETALQPL